MKKQYGSMHMVVIVCLTLALITALGWVFYLNFISKNPEKVDSSKIIKTDTTNTVAENELQTGRTPEGLGSRLVFSYPKGWTVVHNSEFTQDSGTGKKLLNGTITTVTSPDAAHAVKYKVVSGGLGGMCMEEDAGTFSSFSYEALDSINGAFYTEALVKEKSGKYVNSHSIRSVSSETVKSIKAGDSSCKLGFSTLMISDEQKNDPSRGPVQAVMADIIVPKNGDMFSGYDSMEEAKNAYKGSTYEQARAILKSTKIE